MQFSKEAKQRERGITVASLKGIGGNTVLVIVKLIIGLASNSIAIILDAVNNLTDALSSVLTIAGTKLAGREADKEHPFGHGRIEYLTTMAIAFIILSAGVLSLQESIEKILHPVESVFTIPTLIIIAVAIIIKIGMGLYFQKQGRRWNSGALSASGVDALYDAVITGATLISSLLIYFIHINIQGYVGALIGLFIIKAAVDILRDMYNRLLGVRAKDTLVRDLKETIGAHDEVQGVYDLILNSYGPGQTIGSAHITLPETMVMADVHPLTRHLSMEIYKKFGIIMTIGAYAQNESNLMVYEMQQQLERILSFHPHVVQMHAFYVDCQKKIVYYDLILDFDAENPQDILQRVKAAFQKKYPDFKQEALLDIDFSN